MTGGVENGRACKYLNELDTPCTGVFVDHTGRRWGNEFPVGNGGGKVGCTVLELRGLFRGGVPPLCDKNGGEGCFTRANLNK